jgi:ATP-dependent exoDNAse (exonuclease V) beta subunit
LGKRDQWLRRRRRISDPDLIRPELEAALAELVESALAEASERLLPYRHLVAGLANYAGGNSPDESRLAVLRGVEFVPQFDAAELETWRGYAELFLTAKGDVRKSVNVRQGFPAGKGEAANWKARMKDALDELREDGEARVALANVKLLPAASYGDEQWGIIAPIIRVVDLAVACLWGVMAERRACDFGEVAERGLAALGEAQDPSELLLALDRRLKHILVDEFQDTSHLQFQLLERLTEGWERGDGRTLFLVGDPMQSIYRFRESEVALFFKAATDGVGPVALEPLSLTVNFRSDGAVIDWLNEVFAEVFPASDDPSTGAVRYSPCVAFHDGRGVDEPVRIATLAEKEPLREAAEVVDEAIKRREEGSVGILVRSRTHLKPIVSELARRGVSYRGEELDKLKDRAAVKDLRSLLDALFNPGDRLAWLSVLRAPWCGLTLGDLLTLVGDDARPVTEILAETVSGDDNLRLTRMSEAGSAALKRVWPVLSGGRTKAGRLPLRTLIEGVWCALGAPTYLDGQQLADAEALFKVLEALDEAGQPGAPDKLDRAIEGLYARPDPGGDQGLTVMTIHKAKGLEFDTVLVPGLGHRPPPEKGQLIQWAEMPSGGLVIGAPPPTMVGGTSPVRDFIRELDKQKGMNERIRLLYVAATRARSRLVMWGAAKIDNDGEAKPAAGSMLALLWFKVEEAFFGLSPSEEEGAAVSLEPLSVERLPIGWALPGVESPAIALAPVAAQEEESRRFDWAREERKYIGTLAHRIFERISVEGLGRWSAERVESMTGALSNKLSSMGVGDERLADATGDVVKAVKALLEDERGRWIVGAHEEAESEYEFSGVLDGKVERRTIDRTFVADGVRWIVDYKVSTHGGGGLEEFLQSERKENLLQLERYARMFKLKEPEREIRAALYFPLLKRFVEVI